MNARIDFASVTALGIERGAVLQRLGNVSRRETR
jgi:hypothetical protein